MSSLRPRTDPGDQTRFVSLRSHLGGEAVIPVIKDHSVSQSDNLLFIDCVPFQPGPAKKLATIFGSEDPVTEAVFSPVGIVLQRPSLVTLSGRIWPSGESVFITCGCRV